MNDIAMLGAYGILTEPDNTLQMERLLPGPIERVWAYLTKSDLRRQWLAAGRMELKVGAPFEFIWRNDELTDPPGELPEGFSGEHRMKSRITEVDPPRRLSFTWEGSGDVSIELTPEGKSVLLTLVHRRVPDRKMLLAVGPGWHMHLDLLVARASGKEPSPFWEGWARLRSEYEKRIPA